MPTAGQKYKLKSVSSELVGKYGVKGVVEVIGEDKDINSKNIKNVEIKRSLYGLRSKRERLPNNGSVYFVGIKKNGFDFIDLLHEKEIGEIALPKRFLIPQKYQEILSKIHYELKLWLNIVFLITLLYLVVIL